MFTGDSVTDCGRRTDPDGLGDGYVRMLATSLPEHTVLNSGISGNRASDLAARWQTDVAVSEPDVVTVLIGINDTWRRYDSDDPTTAVTFEANYRKALESAVVPRLVLMEPFVLPVTEEQQRWHYEDLDAKIAVVHKLARQYGAVLVPTNLRLERAAVEHGAAALAEDGVHPTALGHELIAAVWREYVL